MQGGGLGVTKIIHQRMCTLRNMVNTIKIAEAVTFRGALSRVAINSGPEDPRTGEPGTRGPDDPKTRDLRT